MYAYKRSKVMPLCSLPINVMCKMRIVILSVPSELLLGVSPPSGMFAPEQAVARIDFHVRVAFSM